MFRFLVSIALVLLFTGICAGQEVLRVPVSDAGMFDPEQGPVKVAYSLLKDADRVKVRVEDFRGRVIDHFDFIRVRAGDREVEWKGLDEDGKRLPEGRYRLIIEARFSDDTAAEKFIDIRIVAIPEEKGVTPPKPLPPKKYVYKIDGSLSTYWRKNKENPENVVQNGEHRARLHLKIKTDNSMADGVLSVRRPYSSAFMPEDDRRRADFDSSWAMAEQKWQGGRLKGVFRQGLGKLDDPLKLFNDYKTERKKVGCRIDQEWKWLRVNVLGYNAEGDVDSGQKGLSGRMVIGSEEYPQVGISVTRQKEIPLKADGDVWNKATAADIRIPVIDGLSLLTEYAKTDDSEFGQDEGYTARVEYDRGGLRVSGGYLDLGENFCARYANPLWGVNSDARGGELDIDYIIRKPFWKIKNISTGLRMFSVETHSTREMIKEGDASLRIGIGQRDALFFNWFGSEKREVRRNSYLFGGRHAWNDSWSSGIRANYSLSDQSHTRRWTADTAFRKDTNFVRLTVERSRQVQDGSTLSPYVETDVRIDAGQEIWQVSVSGRYSKRGPETGTNLFGRFEFRPRFLHRYRTMAYVALGNRAAFETENQIELGMEIRF